MAPEVAGAHGWRHKDLHRAGTCADEYDGHPGHEGYKPMIEGDGGMTLECTAVCLNTVKDLMSNLK